MNTILTKFIVVSLPRTGTKSLLQMMKLLGFEISHAPGPAFDGYLNRFEVIADTPAFRPSVVEKMVSEHPEVKFIYVDKEPDAWVNSMMKIGLSNNYNNMYSQWVTDPESLSSHNMVDLESLKEVMGGPFVDSNASQKFRQHKRTIQRIVPTERLLTYSFTDGWQPLASFVGKDTPAIEVPHLNRDSMFDTITG